jgi:hypothetical protein
LPVKTLVSALGRIDSSTRRHTPAGTGSFTDDRRSGGPALMEGFPRAALARCRRGLRVLPLLATLLFTLPLAQGRRALGESLFTAQSVESSRFIVLGRPVGDDDWTLLVLEQLAPAPRCWTARPDGLVDPSLNRFNFTGICNRYIDSNGYSLRVGDQDLATSHHLRLVQVGSELRLLAAGETLPVELPVGRGSVPLRDRDGFVELRLEPGWTLQRRVYQGRGLSHLYFANPEGLPALLARVRPLPVAGPGAAFGDPASGRGRLSGLPGLSGPSLAGLPDRTLVAVPGRPIPLQVIPFRE